MQVAYISFKLDQLNVRVCQICDCSLTMFSCFLLSLLRNFPYFCFSSLLLTLFTAMLCFPIIVFTFMLVCSRHFCSLLPDEQCEAAASSPQPHPLPAAVWGAGKQPASRYLGSKRCLWWGQEESLLWPLARAGAAAGELHECRLSKRPVIWLWPQLSLQGEVWNADTDFNYSHTVRSPLFLQWQKVNVMDALSRKRGHDINSLYWFYVALFVVTL